MRFDRDTLAEILDTLTKNKSRSFLTAFGVFWGILILVILSGGAIGLKKTLMSNFDGFATNSGFIVSSRTSMAYKGFLKGRYWDIEMRDLDNIKKYVKYIDVITPQASVWGKTAIYGEQKYSDCTVMGVEAKYQFIEAQPMKYGRFINEVDDMESRKVCVIGTEVYESLFKKGVDPCGEYISVDGIHYRVVGVSNSESNISINGSVQQSVVVPVSTLGKAYNMGNTIQVLCFTAQQGHKIKEIEDQISPLLKQAHYIHPDDKQAVRCMNAEEIFEMVENVFIGLNVVTWLVGLGTLLAGVIGVSNIMMVTVKERTSEIGIRRAIGARPYDILQQIVCECLLLTSVAGTLGLSAGVGIMAILDSQVAEDVGEQYCYGISLSTGIGITVVLVILGVFAAVAPALRAMAIKPIEAMREE